MLAVRPLRNIRVGNSHEFSQMIPIGQQPGFHFPNGNSQNQVGMMALRQPTIEQTWRTILLVQIDQNDEWLVRRCIIEASHILAQVILAALAIAGPHSELPA